MPILISSSGCFYLQWQCKYVTSSGYTSSAADVKLAAGVWASAACGGRHQRTHTEEKNKTAGKTWNWANETKWTKDERKESQRKSLLFRHEAAFSLLITTTDKRWFPRLYMLLDQWQRLLLLMNKHVSLDRRPLVKLYNYKLWSWRVNTVSSVWTEKLFK